MTRTAPLSRAASCLVLPKSAIWSRLVSLRLSLECKRLEAPPPGLLMLHHAPLPHFLNEIESFLGLLLLLIQSSNPLLAQRTAYDPFHSSLSKQSRLHSKNGRGRRRGGVRFLHAGSRASADRIVHVSCWACSLHEVSPASTIFSDP